MQLWRKTGSIKDTSRTKEGGRSSGGQQQLRLLPDLKVKRGLDRFTARWQKLMRGFSGFKYLITLKFGWFVELQCRRGGETLRSFYPGDGDDVWSNRFICLLNYCSLYTKEREGRSHGDSTRCHILRRQRCCFRCCHVWFLELEVEHIWMRGWTASVSLLIWKLHQSDLHFNESVTMIKKTMYVILHDEYFYFRYLRSIWMPQLWVRVWIVTLSLYKTVISYKMMLNYSIKIKLY